MKKRNVTYEEVELSQEVKNKCIKYLQKNPITIYWDYREQLNAEQCQQIIDGHLDEVDSSLWEGNLDYICDLEYQVLKEMQQEFPELQNFEISELREEFIDYLSVDLNIEQLLRYTNVNVRIVVNSNYEGFYPSQCSDVTKDEYIKQIKRILKNKVDIKSFNDEILNAMCGPNCLIFYGKVNMYDIYKYDFENWKKIKIDSSCWAGLFDSWNGSGSTLEIKLLKPVTIQRQHGKTEYDDVSILVDDANKYSVMETYGVCNIPELKFQLK